MNIEERARDMRAAGNSLRKIASELDRPLTYIYYVLGGHRTYASGHGTYASGKRLYGKAKQRAQQIIDTWPDRRVAVARINQLWDAVASVTITKQPESIIADALGIPKWRVIAARSDYKNRATSSVEHAMLIPGTSATSVRTGITLPKISILNRELAA